jgi:hypothetical protein
MLDINKMYKGMDARSTRGILSRGKTIYRGTSDSPKSMDLRAAAMRKLRSR